MCQAQQIRQAAVCFAPDANMRYRPVPRPGLQCDMLETIITPHAFETTFLVRVPPPIHWEFRRPLRPNKWEEQMRKTQIRSLNVSIAGTLLALLFSLAWVGESAAQQPQRGGVLSVGFPSDSKTFDPTYSVQITERQVLYTIYNTLVRYGSDFSIQPELAQSWSIENDGKRIVFKLRPNVKFQDGTDFNAEAVKWNIDHRLDKGVA